MKEIRCRGFFCGQNSGDESPHFKVSLHCSQRAKDRRINDCPVLDPANPYGAALPWPAKEDTQARPQRAVGARVILHQGSLASIVTLRNASS